MTVLWTKFKEAEAGYREEDEPRTGAEYGRAYRRVLAAHTVDPAGVAIKLKVYQTAYPSEVIAGIVRDLEAADQYLAR
jgi:hypothetical protein